MHVFVDGLESIDNKIASKINDDLISIHQTDQE